MKKVADIPPAAATNKVERIVLNGKVHFGAREWIGLAGLVTVIVSAVLSAGLWLGGVFSHVDRVEIHQTPEEKRALFIREMETLERRITKLVAVHLESVKELLEAHQKGGPHPEAVELFRSVEDDIAELRERVAVVERN